MAYETAVTQSGLVIVVDDIASLGKIQAVKLDVGADGAVSGPVAAGNPLPIYFPSTPAVSLSGTPNVNVANTPNVAISGTPTVNVASTPDPAITYRAGNAAATVRVTSGRKIRTISCIAGSSGGTVVILGGDTITIPPGGSFDEKNFGNLQGTGGSDVVFTGVVAYYVSWES